MKSVACITLLLCFASLTQAENWPEFRGSTTEGHSAEKNLPVTWGPEENVQWAVDIAGEGWSSPIYWEGRLYLTAAVDRGTGNKLDQSLRTVCLDAKTGAEIWNEEIFQQDADSTQKIHSKNSHASPTPITDGQHVWVHFGTQGTACLTMDGKTVWTNRDLKYKPQHGNGGSPILVDGLLIVSCDGSDVAYVVALDQQTGDVVWKQERPPIKVSNMFSFSTALAITVNGKKQVISPGSDQVIAYDPKTGDTIWQCDYVGYSVIPRPVYQHGLVYVSTSYNTPSLLAIDPTGSGDVTDTHIKWQTNRAAPHTPSVLVVGDEVYMVSDRGILTCLDAKTGDVRYTERLGGNFSASPVYADGRIYFQDEDGKTTVVKPGKEYESLGTSELPGRTLASYAIADGSIFLRTDKQLYRLGKK